MVQEPSPSLEGPEKFSHLESQNNVLNVMITELFFHISLIWTEAPFIQEVSGVEHLSVFRHRWTKNMKEKFSGLSRNGP